MKDNVSTALSYLAGDADALYTAMKSTNEFDETCVSNVRLRLKDMRRAIEPFAESYRLYVDAMDAICAGGPTPCTESPPSDVDRGHASGWTRKTQDSTPVLRMSNGPNVLNAY
jgi:hypothetical protein